MRMTNANRDTTEKKALNAAFASRIKTAESKVANKIVEHLDKCGIPRAADIPAGFEEYISVTGQVHMYGNNEMFRLDLPVMFCNRPHRSQIEISKDFLNKLTEYITLRQIKTSRETAKRQIKQILASVNTDKQLQETSPELYAFYPQSDGTFHAPVAVETVTAVRNLLHGVK
jgi:hypothetical protein